MRRQTRPMLVAVLTALLFINPAFACRNCGSQAGGYGSYYSGNYGGYYSGYSYGYASYGYGGYDGYYDSCCGGGVVVDGGYGCDGCGDCGYGDCGCDGCGSCDGCSSCDGCDSCGTSESIHVESSEPVHAPMPAPEPPVHTHVTPVPTNNNMPPAPTLPPATMPSDRTTEMQPMPPATPAETLPVETTPAPTTTTIEAPADDLFGAPAEEEAPTTTSEPAAPAGGDDLFGPADTAPPAAAEPAAPAGEDDLFGPPADEAAPPAEEAPAEEAPAAESEDDLFGDAGATLRQPGGFASLELRRWKDNTGRHECRGRLLRVFDGKVQLLKDNGRTSTVAFGRLSPEDLAFVSRQANAQRTESLSKTAQADTNR